MYFRQTIKPFSAVLVSLLVLYSVALAAPNPVSESLRTALLEDKVSAVRTYLSRGGNPDAMDKKGTTLLVLASNNGSLDSMKLLLDKKAKVNLASRNGETPLMRATSSLYRSGISSVRLLISRGANVNQAMPKGTTPLMLACSPASGRYESEYLQAVRLFISKGAKVNARNKMGATPLKVAREAGAQKIVEVLKKAGAKV